MSTGLSVSRVVRATVNLTPTLAQFPNLSTCLLLGTSPVIDVTERLRSYNDITAVATDFGTTTEEYLAAVRWFAQSPQPLSLRVGRWVKTDSAGQLICGGLSVTHSALSYWTAIQTGSLTVSVDGSPVDITGLDFSGASSLNGVASVLNSHLPGAVCTYDAVRNRFVITSSTTGASSTISFMTAGGSGTDVSGAFAGLSSSSGAYRADGLVAETALEAVALFDDRFSAQWYGLVVPSGQDSDHLAVAAFIEASTNPHHYGVTTQESGVLVAGYTADIAHLFKAQGFENSSVQYSSTDAYAVMSYLARVLTTNWSANNSVITLMFKNEPGVTAENLSASQMDALLSKNCNVFVQYNNDTAIIQPGITPSGQFTDSVIGCAWLQGVIQTNVWNLLYGRTTKIPQTDDGMHVLATGIEAACMDGVKNGLLAPGVWNSGGFGQLKQGDFLTKGYYVYAPPLALQSESDRQARRSVAFQVAAKLGGAVHSADVAVLVNQ